MKKPDFFIVGAPKSGTTAMDSYLGKHPDVIMAHPKELHFFGSDLNYSYPGPSLEQYRSSFANAKDGKLLGESSVWYLYSKLAASEIKEFSPDAKIIIMLRNPVDMLYSQHCQFLYNGNEDIISFEKALEAEEKRKNGLLIPKSATLPEGLYYKETVKYFEQVKRYLEIFGRENVHIIIFEDFKKDTALSFRDTLVFLGLDDNSMIDLNIINPNKKVRFKIIRELLSDLPDYLRLPVRMLMPITLKSRLIELLRRLNIRYVPRPDMPPELRGRLNEEFRADIEKLSSLIDRDLSFWCNGQGE